MKDKRFSIKYQDGTYTSWPTDDPGALSANGLPMDQADREVFKIMTECSSDQWATANKEYRVY